jgi:hypothetical protein
LHNGPKIDFSGLLSLGLMTEARCGKIRGVRGQKETAARETVYKHRM